MDYGNTEIPQNTLKISVFKLSKYNTIMYTEEEDDVADDKTGKRTWWNKVKQIWENKEHPWVDTSIMTLSLESALSYTLLSLICIYLKLYAQELSILSTAPRQEIIHSAMSFRAMQFISFGCSLWWVFNAWNLTVTRTAFCDQSMDLKHFFSATIGLGFSH